MAHGGYCAHHYQISRERFERSRGTAVERGYGRRWQKARVAYLAHHPYCVECERSGVSTPATVVDHITPHRGDWTLFWDAANWQPLCKRHHDAKTRREVTPGAGQKFTF